MTASLTGITALVPPEILYACGTVPCDVNNVVPASREHPRDKLCAWTATWRDMILANRLKLDNLVVVAGGDCHNALVDGQRAARAVRTHYFFYPFDGDTAYLEGQLDALAGFLGGITDAGTMSYIAAVKRKGRLLEERRAAGTLSAAAAFDTLIRFSDLDGDPAAFDAHLDDLLCRDDAVEGPRIALIGVPPIYPDFYHVLDGLGFHVVFDELPHEFIRLSGTSTSELAQRYAGYTFARPLAFRIDLLQAALKRQNVDGIVHYTQFACHHTLEDSVFREAFDLPMITIQGDVPTQTTEQVKLRLEAFRERLGRQR